MARSVSGWREKYAFDRPRIVRAAPPPPTAEELETQRVQRDALTARFLADMAAKAPANRGLTKLVDREARVAVEGDTDLNHDSIEAAK